MVSSGIIQSALRRKRQQLQLVAKHLRDSFEFPKGDVIIDLRLIRCSSDADRLDCRLLLVP